MKEHKFYIRVTKRGNPIEYTLRKRKSDCNILWKGCGVKTVPVKVIVK